MRRPVLALSVAAGLLCAAGVSAAATTTPVPVTVPSTPATAGFTSPNVKHIGTIPLEGVGVSMEVRKVGAQVRAFVSGAAGLSVYDATNPKAPTLLGHLPVYNFENEDIAVSADGKRAFLTEFTASGYLHAVDVSNPTVPVITDTIVRNGPHTVVCANDACTHLYGSDGRTYDTRNMADISVLPPAENWSTKVGATGSIHNLHRDEAGLWVTDTTPLVMFEQLGGDPLKLRRIAEGGPNAAGFQHNNIRPDADRWASRPLLPGPDGTPSVLDTDPALRPGELLLTNGETNFTGQCRSNAGSFASWSVANFDKKTKFKQLDVLRPLSGDYTNGDPAVTPMGCSGHWFTEKDSADGKSVLVAGAWYENGTRFLTVDKTSGKISQVGYFQPVRGAASEAYWMPGSNVVWTVDFHSGIDIVEFSETAPKPTTAEVDASWMLKKELDPFAEAVRQLCKAGADLAVSEDLPGHVAEHHAVEQVATATFAGLARLE